MFTLCTDAAVRAVLRANGVTLRKNDGEYRVSLRSATLSPARLEAMAGYTNDRSDALATGLALAAWASSATPAALADEVTL